MEELRRVVPHRLLVGAINPSKHYRQCRVVGVIFGSRMPRYLFLFLLPLLFPGVAAAQGTA
jgi:hypothetical protein